MNTRPPAEIGARLQDIETPALLIDLDAFERNLRRLADRTKAMGVRLRPHAKTHKSAVIARRQMALGAVGVCCQKVSEAEAMVNGGVPDVLVSNEIVEPCKLERLAALARQARIGVCVDDAANVDAISAAAQSYGSTIDVLVEINVGSNRCGVDPGEPALGLAQRIARSPGLRFRGLQGYHGKAQHIRSFEARRAAVAEAVEKARDTRALLARHGLDCEDIAGAGTGTFAFEAQSGVYTELQAGSYIFMDADYARNLGEAGGPVEEFEHALFVYATVMSTPTRERLVLDAGFKALSFDSGPPKIADLDDVEYVAGSDEHGNVRVTPSNRPLTIGDRVRLIPGHCDPTVNLHDWYVGYRGERVEALWPIARGPGY
ncbi:MAG: DSD1 family PLP-dependent enzyme [Methylobacteriaceae bacterium]|nr:DSD1 family PLP-dependent enzyme [Methylobacteriaceae bacterium]